MVTETLGWVASAPANTTSPGAGTGDYSPEMDPGWFASMMVAIVQVTMYSLMLNRILLPLVPWLWEVVSLRHQVD